jgi:hypothetical protein
MKAVPSGAISAATFGEAQPTAMPIAIASSTRIDKPL